MILGVRCSNTDYSFSLLKGSKDSPQLVDVKSALYPRGYTKANILRWLSQEVEDYLAKNNEVRHITIKGAEPMAQKGSTYSDRVESEAILFLAAANNGLTASRKIKSTIAKDLGLAGRAKALDEDLDTTAVADFQGYSAKEREAILAAWSDI